MYYHKPYSRSPLASQLYHLGGNLDSQFGRRRRRRDEGRYYVYNEYGIFVEAFSVWIDGLDWIRCTFDGKDSPCTDNARQSYRVVSDCCI